MPPSRQNHWISRLRDHGRHLAGLCIAGLLSACSTLTPAPVPVTDTSPVHEGRLFLRVNTTPPSVTQADIRLQGSPEAGQLTLFGPLGTTHGQLSWTPGEAVWTQGQEEHRFSNLDSLLSQTLGVSLPVPAVFAWIEGRRVEPEGWELLSLPSEQQPLVARRLRPLPTLDLRLRLMTP
jgi:outer membrane lipoprotein LolB